MALLLNTDIDLRIHKYIKGKIARIGGTVDDLMDYSSAKVTDINLINGGYGYVKRIRDIKSFRNVLGTIRRYAKQEFKHLIYGEKIPLDRRTLALDMHEAYLHPKLRRKFDAVISSNVVEHAPNPISFLLNCYFIAKKSGYQYHAIPHYKYTYDVYRKPTPFKHFIEDFENKTGLNDTAHIQDYIDSAIIKHGWQKKFHQTYPVAYPYMHHHVYDEFNTKELAEFMFEEVINDIYSSQTSKNNVVLFKNTLNKKFLEKYSDIIDSYSNNFLNSDNC